MLRIAIVGPESSGKTTLCGALAVHFQASLVHEFARAYLGPREGRYDRADLLLIAEAQCAAEDTAMREDAPVVFCDTDMVTIRIWSEEKFGACDPRIIRLSEERHYDHWLLCSPDMPWEQDPLRENPLDRDRLFSVHEALLNKLGKPYTIIQGENPLRMRTAIARVSELLSGPDAS